MTSNSKTLSRNNLGFISPPKYKFVIKDAVNLLSTQISWELFILTLPLAVPPPFSWLSSCSGFAELCTTILSSTVWRDSVGRAQKDFLGMQTSHEKPGKDCRPNPPEDKDGARAPKEGLGQELQNRFYNISVIQNDLVCNNRATSGVRNWEGERVQGSKEKTQTFAWDYRGCCLGGLWERPFKNRTPLFCFNF